MKELLYIGIAQGVLLSILLIIRNYQSNNNTWYLAVFVLALTGIISGPLLNEYFSTWAGLFPDPLVFLIGPSIYLFILSFSQNLNWKDHLVHAIPFLIYIPVLILFYQLVLNSAPNRLDTAEVYGSFFAILIASSKFIHLLLYGYASFGALKRHENVVQTLYSSTDGKDLHWLKILLWSFLILTVVSILIYITAIQFSAKQMILTLFNLSLFSVFLYVLTFFGLRQQNILVGVLPPTLNSETRKKKSLAKYEKSGLKEREIDSLKEQVIQYLETGQFKNPDLNLQQVAEALNTQPHKLSELLNKYMGISFYDLVNRYRVQEVQRLLMHPSTDHLTILAIALENGFNSKSSFNTAFKKFTGMTPSHFRKLNR